MVRSKSAPSRGGRPARTRQATAPGWEASQCWWCGEGAATWEAAGSLSIKDFALGSGRLSRGCTQAFSYAAAPAPGDGEDEALRELSAAFLLPPGPEAGAPILGLGQLGARMIAVGHDARRLELWAAAAAAAREVLRGAMAHRSCAWWTLFVALKVQCTLYALGTVAIHRH